MKYLIVTNHSYMLWQFRRELIAKLLESTEVVISTPFVGHEDDFKAMGCRCLNIDLSRRGINPIKDIKLIKEYRKLLISEKPDKVITYSIKPNVYVGFLCQKLGIPYYVNVQGLGTAFQNRIIAPIVTVMYRVALKKANTVFFENEGNANEFVKRRITPRTQQTLLHGAGVNLDYYSYQEYPSEEAGIHFLFLGRIMREKGVEEFFEAAKKMKEKYGDKVVFDVVGFFEDEYKNTVEDLASKEVIVFHGFQSETRPYYSKSHCVVLPSYHEGMSNVLLEAASIGRAVITSDIPGCREAVDDKMTGMLCKKQDVGSLYECMEYFVETTVDNRVAMGIAGRKKMKNEFDKELVVANTIQVLEDAI